MSSPLSVLITNARTGGGGEARYVVSLADQLRKSGRRILIGCKSKSVLADRGRMADVPVLDEYVFRGGLRPRAWRHDLALMRSVLIEQKPDIIHVNSSQDHWVAAVSNRLLGRPSCLVRTRHNTYLVGNSWPNRVLNRDWTDFQIIVCRYMQDQFAAQPMFDRQRLATVHNGVDAEFYRPDPVLRDAARAEFGYSNEDVVIGIAARLNPVKGHDLLFRAVGLLIKELPNLRLLVLGHGGSKDELATLARDLGIAHAVTFAGQREDMQRCVQAFDIGAQPSLEETSSFSLKEQMAAEKPVVTSDFAACKEIVDDGVEGFTAPVGTVEPLADAIRRLAVDREMRLRMGRAGRERVLREFSVQEFCRRTIEAYGKALEVHKMRRAAR